MKKLLFLILIMVPIILFSQTTNEKTAEVLGHTFSVGDTLTFTMGSMPNGDFISTSLIVGLLDPATYRMNSDVLPHLPSQYIDYKFIIKEIKIIKDKDGINNSVILVIPYRKVKVWVNAKVAMIKKEIKVK
jgi:hypothetical protein